MRAFGSVIRTLGVILTLFLTLVQCNQMRGQEQAWPDVERDDSLSGTFSDRLNHLKERFTESGLTLHFDATYVFQGVASGGFRGPYFAQFSDETSAGNTISNDLRAEWDTEKLGWWSGGAIRARVQDHFGRSIVQRAGSIAAVNNEAIYPNVVDRFDQYGFAVTELYYEHTLNDVVSVYCGLLNTSSGDVNLFAGSALSHSQFLNLAMLYSAVENPTSPHTALGAGVSVTPMENVTGSFSVYGSEETAGENPFRNWHGTTLSSEWTLSHVLKERPGAQTFGFLYGIDLTRADLTTDPRLALASIVLGLPIPSKTANTWAFYYNAHQFIQGDDAGGWGVFARWGISDGDPNLVKLSTSIGVGGIGPIESRPKDRWGLGVYVLDMSNASLLRGLHITDEVGAEMFYNFALSPTLNVSPDIQLIDSGLPKADTTWVVGLRANFSF